MNLDRAIAKVTTIPSRDMRVTPERDYWWAGPLIFPSVCWPVAGLLEALHQLGAVRQSSVWVLLMIGATPPMTFVFFASVIGIGAIGVPWAWRKAARPIRRRRLRRARYKYAAGHHTLATLESAVWRAYRDER